MINKDLLDILVCPACHGEVALKNETIICQSCGKIYPVKDDIPIMLIEEADKNES